MAMTVPYSCDACNADISSGDGRLYLLQLGAVRIPLKTGTVLGPTGNDIPTGQKHFCNYTCLGAWAAKAIGVEQIKLDAAADVAAAEAKPVTPLKAS